MEKEMKFIVYENKVTGSRFYTNYDVEKNYDESEIIVEKDIDRETAIKLCEEKLENTIEEYIESTLKEFRTPSIDNFIANMIRNGH